MGKTHVLPGGDSKQVKIEHAFARRFGLPFVPTLAVGGGALVLERRRDIKDQRIGGMLASTASRLPVWVASVPAFEQVADLLLVVHARGLEWVRS